MKQAGTKLNGSQQPFILAHVPEGQLSQSMWLATRHGQFSCHLHKISQASVSVVFANIPLLMKVTWL